MVFLNSRCSPGTIHSREDFSTVRSLRPLVQFALSCIVPIESSNLDFNVGEVAVLGFLAS